jgi:hypothetical protein
MIFILLTRSHAYTVQHYLETWGRDARGFVRTLFYEDLAFGGRFKPGTYVFSDLERLDDAQLDLAKLLWRTLAARPESFRLLNDPSQALRRYELLTALHADGTNRFRAHRLNNGSMPTKFPLFLRRESEHDGAISALLNSAEELDRAVAEATSKGVRRDDLLAVEYCDTSDAAGVFRKYSAFRVGGRMIARHALFSRKWVVKLADETDGAWDEEERAYLLANPHETELRRIFDLAHIDYGRIDYSLLDGRIQAWEINTNPTISVAPHKLAPGRLVGQQAFMRQLKTAWEAVELKSDAAPAEVRVDGELARRLGVGPVRRTRRFIAKGVRWLANRPFVTENG